MASWKFTKGLHDLGNGGYAWLQPDGSWGYSNAGLIVDQGENLLVDTLFDLAHTREMLDAFRASIPAAERIGTIVNTHSNGDHTFGNQLAAGARILASRACAEEMNQHRPEHRAEMARRWREFGHAGAAAHELYDGKFDFEGIVYTPPTETFEHEKLLHVGSKEVLLVEVGPAHTRGDVLVHIPQDRMVFTGDIVFNGGHPPAWAGPISNWIKACDMILAWDVEIVVPGHGPITDKHGVREMKRYFEFISAETRKRFESGMSEEEAAADIALDSFPGWLDEERIVVNVNSLYRGFGATRAADRNELHGRMSAWRRRVRDRNEKKPADRIKAIRIEEHAGNEMIPQIDDTHDAGRKSWVESANRSAIFPLQNLPLGIFSNSANATPRGGVAIGDEIFDVRAAVAEGLFDGIALQAAQAVSGTTLNAFMALGGPARVAFRRRVFDLLGTRFADAAKAEALKAKLIHRAADCTLHLPAAIGSFTDFYAGIQHAINGGLRRNPKMPLNPNYKHVPVAYHSRASSVVVSGTPVRRPKGQMQLAEGADPVFGPTRKFDMELELGMWIGSGNKLGEPIPISEASDHLVGLCMLNDWSARDIQQWETLPLGPFLAKNFCTTISPWVVIVEALAPFRQPQRPRPADDPRPLPYLWHDEDQEKGAFNIAIEALIQTPKMRETGMAPHRMSLSNLNHLYWTPAQMIAHHTCGGCNLLPGDLFGSGTISAPELSGFGCMRELSENETNPQQLPTNELRIFAEDGDDIILRARAERSGFATIGFGDCSGRVSP